MSNIERFAGTGLLTITGVGVEKITDTTFTVHSGSGTYLDALAPGGPAYRKVFWNTQENITDAFVGTEVRTFITIDSTTGLVFQFANAIPAASKRRYIQVGVATHGDPTAGAIDSISLAPDTCYSLCNSLIDQADALRLVNIDGGANFTGYSTSTNQLSKTSAIVWGNGGRNYVVNPDSPNTANVPVQDPVPFFFDGYHSAAGDNTILINGSGLVDTTTYDDLSGTPATIDTGFWITHRLYIEPSSGLNIIVKGQVPHKGKIEAIQSINTEKYQAISATKDWLLTGFITFREGESGFLDNPDVIFSNADKFGQIAINELAGNGTIFGIPSFKDYTFTSNGVGAGVYYAGGFYDAPAADTTLTQASLTQTLGVANVGYNAHAFAVFGGAGAVDTGQVGLRVNGTTYDETTGVRTASDSDIITDDITAVALNEYLDTSKHFIGQVTYELYVVSGSPTTYSVDFNYGLAKWEDFNDRDHMIVDFEVTGLAGVNDSGFNMELLKHSPIGWTYHATAFVPGNGVLASWSDSYAPEDELSNGVNFAYKRADLDEPIRSSLREGSLVRITTGANNSVQEVSIHLGVEF